MGSASLNQTSARLKLGEFGVTDFPNALKVPNALKDRLKFIGNRAIGISRHGAMPVKPARSISLGT